MPSRAAVGLVLASERDVVQAVAHLPPRSSMLLVLDNCEHVLERPSRCVAAIQARAPPRARARHQPGAAERVDEQALPPRAVALPRRRDARDARSGSRGGAVRGARARGRSALRARRRNRAGDRRHLPPARRHPAGDRAGGRARAAARRRRPAGRLDAALPPAHRRGPHRAAPAPDAARQRSTGATSCSRRESRRCSGGWACSRAASPSTPCSRWRRSGTLDRVGGAGDLARWSTSRWWWPTATRPRATGCSRRRVRSRWSASATPARRTRSCTGTPRPLRNCCVPIWPRIRPIRRSARWWRNSRTSARRSTGSCAATSTPTWPSNCMHSRFASGMRPGSISRASGAACSCLCGSASVTRRRRRWQRSSGLRSRAWAAIRRGANAWTRRNRRLPASAPWTTARTCIAR